MRRRVAEASHGGSLKLALHRCHHTYYYAPEEMFDMVRDMAKKDAERWWDYLESQLDHLGGDVPMAADFIDHADKMGTLGAVVASRPHLRAFVGAMEPIQPYLPSRQRRNSRH